VVAQPLRRAETLAIYSGSCVAPLRLGGRRGKQSTPRVWLGGTGELPAVGKRERLGSAVVTRKRKGKGTLVDLMKKNVVGITIDLILLALGGKILSFNRCLVLLVHWF
jgi:hypothetical protein